MKHLLYILCALLLLLSCRTSLPAVKRTASAHDSSRPVWSAEMRSDSLKNSYRLTLKYNDKALSGLLFLKKSAEGWRGTMINEMGSKIFDFLITDDRCDLLDLVPVMDKWYIRREITSDLFFLVNADNANADFTTRPERFEQNDVLIINLSRKQLILNSDGSLTLINSLRGLRYDLRRITELDNNKLLL
ncbi:MAG: hypothetical protein LBS80_02925 [Tannerella sp.]|jgi:hypothetical protein|nr:hypothetical protein [Tannerella sp.]